MPDPQPGRYCHYKGHEYTVLGMAQHSESLDELVLYRQEYGDHSLWVRPKKMFFETVKFVVVLQGAARLRFDDGEIELKPGSFLDIPAHKRHRVEWTTPDEPTIWLAIYYGALGQL